MRVAFVGKGGAGKSAIAGTLARQLARRGRRVLAADSDPMPGLAFALGLPSDDAPIPDEAIAERPEGGEGPRFFLRAGLDAETAVERYAAAAPDGVRFLQFGKLRGHPGGVVRSQHAFRQIVDELPGDRWDVVGDLPGGTRQAFFGWAAFADTVLVVVEPTVKSLLSGRRLARLRDWDRGPARVLAVANKVRSDGDAELVADRTGLEVIAQVPYDEELAAAERAGRPPLDAAPSSAAVHAVASLGEKLEVLT